MKKSLLLSLFAVAVLSGGTYFFFFRSSQIPYELVKVTKGTISQEVIVTGKTKPLQDVSLAFERSGKVSRIFAAVGDRVYDGQVLAELDRTELSAQLSQAEANLETQKAKLAELKTGTRPEELKIQEGKVSSAQTALLDARQNMADKIQESYTKADDSVRNIADQFFNNPRSANPQISFTVGDQSLKGKLETGRFDLETSLTAWRLSLDQLNLSADLGIYSRDAIANAGKVKTFLDNAALAVNALTPSITISQTTIDGWKSNLSSARTSMNAALANLSSAKEKLSAAEASLILAENQLNLDKAGTSPEAIAAQEAQVKQAQANVESARAQLSKAIIKAPIPGVVTKQDVKVGEIVSANTPLISIISLGNLQIEANIPEVDIGKVMIGNPVNITVDAFPGEAFSGKVTYIDPAETIIDGVVNFRLTIIFNSADARLKSGLTANLNIQTLTKSDVLILPQYAILEYDSGVFARIQDGNSTKEIPIVIGIRGQDGGVEIISGVSEGDEVLNVGFKAAAK